MGQVSELLAKLNSSLSYRSKSALATDKTLVDNPSAIYKKAIQTAIAPDIFEGAMDFEAIVLLTFETDSETTFFSKLAQGMRALPLFTGFEGEASKAYYFCYIPRLHGHMINPLEFVERGDISEFITRVERLPFFLSSPTIEQDSPIGIGSLVTISFMDSNRSASAGIISSVQMRNNIDLSGQFTTGIAAHGRANALPPRTNLVCEGPSSDATESDIYEAYQEDGMTQELAEEIISASKELGINPAWLANAMHFESGYTFDPSKQHPSSTRATGLIQFTKKTAKELGTTTEQLRKMTVSEQMKYVVKYFNLARIPQMTSQEDVYMAIYFPTSVGQGSDFDIYQWHVENEGPVAARKYLRNNNGTKTVGDYVSAANSRAKLPC